jgi:hypothetical protein
MLDELIFVNAKLPRTVRLLLSSPGQLTTEWLRGRRVSYLHPFRLYLLTAALYFVLSPLLHGDGGGLLASMAEGFAHDSVGADGRETEVARFVVAWWPRLTLVGMVPVGALGLRFVLERQHRFVEHLVFTLHFHAVVFLLLLAVLPAALLPIDSPLVWLQAVPYLLAPVFLAASFRRHFGRGLLQAIVRTGGFALLYATGFTLIFVGVTLFAMQRVGAT